MKLLRRSLALVLAYALGLQPAVAQVEAIHIAAPVSNFGAGTEAASTTGGSAGAIRLQTFAPTPSLSLAPALVSAFNGAPSILVPAAPFAARTGLTVAAPGTAPAAAPALVAPSEQPAASVPTPSVAANTANSGSAPAATPAQRVATFRAAANQAVEGLDHASLGDARGMAGVQFSALTGEHLAASIGDGVEAPSGKVFAATPARAYLDAPTAPPSGSGNAAAAVPAPQAPKPGYFRIFNDPDRNKAFWRYVLGYCVFLLPYEMYVVAQPYMISSEVTNALAQKHDPRGANQLVVNELIRTARSESRVAQWVAQFISYATIPLFTRNAEKDGPRKWLVKATFIRAGMLAGIASAFFATGLIGMTTLWVTFGFIALQSFFQGIAITSEGAGTTRIIGDKSVTSDERTRANSILTIISSVISIIGPIVAGGIALMGPVHGMTGVGGAVIYAIYAGAMALTAFIYSTIKMFAGPGSNPDAAAAPSAAPKTFGGVMKGLWDSIKVGTGIVLKNPLLRTMLILSTIGSLFSDPLVFNVLPEYVDKLAGGSAGMIGAIMHVPVLGWLLKTLMSTPMGNFSLMMTMASVGNIIAAVTIKPVTKVFQKLGFKTDEALTVPFYILSAAQAPLFFFMIHTPSLLGVVGLYGLQSLAVGYIGIAISGLYQKTLGAQKDEDVTKILAVQSLFGIGAAIISTVVYGFLLTNIPIATSMLIAAIATTVVSALSVAAPFLSFTRAQRHPADPPAPPVSVPPAHAMPPHGHHNGPHSINSLHH